MLYVKLVGEFRVKGGYLNVNSQLFSEILWRIWKRIINILFFINILKTPSIDKAETVLATKYIDDTRL